MKCNKHTLKKTYKNITLIISKIKKGVIYICLKKISEGKTKHQAIICIMRRLTNIIYKVLKEDMEYQHPEELIEKCKVSFRERTKLEEEKQKKKQELKEKRLKEKNLYKVNC